MKKNTLSETELNMLNNRFKIIHKRHSDVRPIYNMPDYKTYVEIFNHWAWADIEYLLTEIYNLEQINASLRYKLKYNKIK